jgi:5-methylcytosine-specific restriction endonuclease McrA
MANCRIKRFRKPRISGRQRTVIRQRRRKTLYKMLRNKNCGRVPCFVCGEHVAMEDVSLEHILPLSLGGTDDMDNLAISHRSCNMRRGNDISAGYLQ